MEAPAVNRPSLSPSYLIRNRYSYCFRIRVPADLQSTIRKTELRFSLKTGYLGIAKTKARLLAGLFQNLFSFLRGPDIDMLKLSEDQIAEIILQFKEIALNEYQSVLEDPTVKDGRPAAVMNAFEKLLALMASLKHDLATDEFPWIEPHLNSALEALQSGFSAETDKQSPRYKKISREMARAALQTYEDEKSFMEYQYPELGLARLYGQNSKEGNLPPQNNDGPPTDQDRGL